MLSFPSLFYYLKSFSLVGIEATTIVSAFLVALYRKGEALEAAWKYLMICGAGIAIALLGVILLYSSAVNTLGTSPDILNWSFLKDPGTIQ
jgi:hydrogenase-4 component F